MKLAILGTGPGGYVAAIRSAQLGAHVTVIEEKEVGGTCLNWGCIPTKSFVASAEIFSKTRRLEEYGLELHGEIIPNFSKIIERKNKIVNTQINGIRNLFKSWGITLKQGRGTIISPREIRIAFPNASEETIEADNIVIATGSRPYELPGIPFDGKRIISSDEALNLSDMPKRLIIIGAGVIGCEFACIYRELGSEVSIIEMLPRVLPTEDLEISRLFERELKKKRITLYLNTKVQRIDMHHDSVHVFLSDGKEAVAEKVLVSVGRAFNSNNIGLKQIGINIGSWGEIVVNKKMETNIPNVYAIGDVTGGFMFAHVASREGIIAAENVSGCNKNIDYSAVPSAIFTSPEIASVGIREHQAEEKGLKVKTGYFQFRALARAHAISEIEGFIKIISDEKTDKVLGVHIMGPHATELIHQAALAISTGLKAKDIAETIYAHPTLSEGLMEAAKDIYHEAIHIQKQ
jgi:dihydrolipoamide dehydrogenase